MRIGFVLQDPARLPPTGLDVYTAGLWDALHAVENEFDFVPVTLPARIARRAYLRTLWEQLYLPLWARRQRIDLLHVPAGSAPVLRGVPCVLTLHDLGDDASPAYRTPLGPRLYFRRVVPASARSADALLCDSESTKSEALERLGIPADRATVVPLAAPGWYRPAEPDAVAAVRERHGLGERYFLFVGSDIPRKNLAGALSGFARFRDRCPAPEVQLVIAGSGHRMTAQAGVRFLGRVRDNELPALYTGALAVVMPSFYEGFGLPIVEASACGTPAIASRVASLPAVAGDAALYIDPQDAGSIADAMERLATEPALREELAARARARSRLFSWRITAEATLAVYRRVLAERGSRRAVPGRAPKILFVRLDSLGDLVLTTPCFEAVKRAYPDATVHVVARPKTAALLDGDPRVERVHTLDAPWHGAPRLSSVSDVWRALRRLRRESYDCVFTPRRDLDDALFARLCGGRETLGFLATRTRPFLSGWVPFVEGKHTVENHLALTGLLGCATGRLTPQIFCTSGSPDRVATLVGEGEDAAVALAPFGSTDRKSLRAPAAAALIDRLASGIEGPIILLGGCEQRRRADDALRLAGAHVIDLVGRTDLGELCDVLRRCRLFVGVDSGPMHLAAGLGLPVVALFGDQDPALWGPYSDAPQRVLRPLDAPGRLALDGIAPERVLAAARELLELEQAPQRREVAA